MRLDSNPNRYRAVVTVPVPPGTDDATMRAPVDDATITRFIESAAVSKSLKQPLKIARIVWNSAFVLNQRQIESHVAGRVVFAGDAAHCHSPIGAQGTAATRTISLRCNVRCCERMCDIAFPLGMNLGMQDSNAIAWRLSLLLRQPTASITPLLRSYGVERGSIAHMIVSSTDRANFVLTPPVSPSTWHGALLLRALHLARNNVVWYMQNTKTEMGLRFFFFFFFLRSLNNNNVRLLTLTSFFPDTLGRTLSQIEHSYVSCATSSCGVGVDARPAPWTERVPYVGYARARPLPGARNQHALRSMIDF